MQGARAGWPWCRLGNGAVVALFFIAFHAGTTGITGAAGLRGLWACFSSLGEGRCGHGVIPTPPGLDHQPRMAYAAAFFHSNLGGDAFLQRFDVADDADHLATGVQRIQCGQRHFQRVAVQRAKAFVQEQ